MRSRHGLICVAFVATACAGDDAGSGRIEGPTFAVGTIAPGAAPEGDAVLNIHWFPKDGGDSVAALRIDGLPAVWSAANNILMWEPQPVEGTAIQVGIGHEVPPIVIPTGAHTIELVLDGAVIAGETVDVGELTVYSLTAYGERAAPRELFFADPMPGTHGTTFPGWDDPVPVTVYNLMPGGVAIYGSLVSIPGDGSQERVFEGLAYGQAWSGSYTHTEVFHVNDEPQPAMFPGGFLFRNDSPGRFYVYFREPNTGDLGAVTDIWFRRAL